MDSGHYVAVHVTSVELPQLVDWLDERVEWGPVPCTSYTKDTISWHWRNLSKVLVENRDHRIPFQVKHEQDLMLVKLSWNVIEHYPMSEHLPYGKRPM